MAGIGKQAKDYFSKINTKHLRHRLHSGVIVDLSKEDNNPTHLRQLGEQSPDIFVLKKPSNAKPADTKSEKSGK